MGTEPAATIAGLSKDDGSGHGLFALDLEIEPRLHSAFFGLASGAIALGAGAGTGRRTLATAAATAVGLLGWLINGFAPVVHAIAWLKYLSPFYYYAAHDPLTEGVGILDVAVLGLLALLCTAVAVLRIERRDLGT